MPRPGIKPRISCLPGRRANHYTTAAFPVWNKVGQGPTALAVGAGGGCLDIFTLIYPFFPLSPSLWETAQYRLKYCLKGPLNPKPTNQPRPSDIYIAVLNKVIKVTKLKYGEKDMTLPYLCMRGVIVSSKSAGQAILNFKYTVCHHTL